MDKIKILKFITRTIVGIGSNQIVRGFVQNNTDPQKMRDKVAIACATFALGGIVSTAAKEYTDETIDEWAKAITIKNGKIKFQTTDVLGEVIPAEPKVEAKHDDLVTD